MVPPLPTVRPAGKPDAFHVYGDWPPVPCRVARNGTPTSATRRETDAVSGWSTLSVNCLVSIRVPSADGSVETPVAVTVNVDEPTAAGVPVMLPFDDSVSPAGNEPALTFHVTFDRTPAVASVAEYGAFTVPGFRASVEIVNRLGQISKVNSSSALLPQ